MATYIVTPTNFAESFNDVATLINGSHRRGTKDWHLGIGMARRLPMSLRYLNYYFLTKDITLLIPNVERITRSTSLDYFLSILNAKSRTVTTDDSEYSSPLTFSKEQLDNLKFKSVCAIHFINVEAQIQDTFETKLPQWARSVEAEELLGISLALKLTPKHRVRVYKRNDHIFIFTTKGITDSSENYYEIFRKVWACLPLIYNWSEVLSETDYKIITDICKTLANADATSFWNLLTVAFNNCSEIKNLKYQNIITTFNNVTTARVNQCNNRLTRYRDEAARYLAEYARNLELTKDVQRQLVELQNTDIALDTTVIRHLVDKRICYALKIDNITNPDGLISYRCMSPLLSYDKDAACALYNRRVKGNYSNTMVKLFKLLFIDEKVILNFDEVIDIKLNKGTFTARSGHVNLYVDLDTSFPNPHHFYYNCWGSYAPTITKLIHEFKLEELFYQIKASIGSLNFTDYTVVSRFLDHLACVIEGDYNPSCFYWRDENCTTLHTLQETLNHFEEEE